MMMIQHPMGRCALSKGLKERLNGLEGLKDLNKGPNLRSFEVEDLIHSGTPKKDLKLKIEAEVKRNGTKHPVI